MNNSNRTLSSNPLLTLEREILTSTSVQKDFIKKSYNDISICRGIASGVITEEVAQQILDMYKPYKELMDTLIRQGNKVVFIPVTFIDNKVLDINDVFIQLKYTDCDLRLQSDKYKNLYFNEELVKSLNNQGIKLYVGKINNLCKYKNIGYLLDSLMNSTIVTGTDGLLDVIYNCVQIENVYKSYNYSTDNRYTINFINNAETVLMQWIDNLDKVNKLIAAITIKYDIYDDSKKALSKLEQDADKIREYSTSDAGISYKLLNNTRISAISDLTNFYMDIIDYLSEYIKEYSEEDN